MLLCLTTFRLSLIPVERYLGGLEEGLGFV
jgi:hypothetical protein